MVARMKSTRTKAKSIRPSRSTKSRRGLAGKLGKPAVVAIPPPQNVSIQVLLTAPESPILTLEQINSENVHNFRPSKATQDQAAVSLTDLGFKIIAIGPHSISVEAPPALFTKTFGTELEVRNMHRVHSARPTREKSYYATKDGASWELPIALKGLVERAYVQRPSVYLESPLPPNVPYFPSSLRSQLPSRW